MAHLCSLSQRGHRETAGPSPGADFVHKPDDVLLAPLLVVLHSDAPATAHPTVESRGHDDNFFLSAGGVEEIAEAVLVADNCMQHRIWEEDIHSFIYSINYKHWTYWNSHHHCASYIVKSLT